MMLEFTDKGTNWLVKKQELSVTYRMESEEASRKRKIQELSSSTNDDIVKRSDPCKRRRLREDSTNRNNNIHHQRMSLDLELNLSPSLDLNHHDDHDDRTNYYTSNEETQRKKKGSILGLQTQKRMVWVAFDHHDDEGCHRSGGGVSGGREEEMVAKVCMKCHMLVMLCKASPACPNCKFMHSPEDATLSLLFANKPTLLA